MKTIKFLSDVDDFIKKDNAFNVSDISFEKLKAIHADIKKIAEDESAKILPSDKIPYLAIKQQRAMKTIIKLPSNEMDIEFALRLALELQKQNVDLFYDPSTTKIVEITEWHDPLKDNFVFGKRYVDAIRIKAILENKFLFESIIKDKDGGFKEVTRSAPKALLEFAMATDELRNALRKLNGVFESPAIYIKEGQLKIANRGYNPDCCVYVRLDAPEIKELPIGDAKALLNDCLLDFPFESEQDKVFAIAAIITPMLRGIYGQYGVRTPLFIYLGNQQGCGKDYCAGIRQIIYTGRFNEDAPISNDKGSNSEETDKIFVSAAISGQQFMHFSNCRGHLQNASLEKHQTASSIRGRGLSTNIIIESENILEVSLSGNYGLTFNKDVARRSLFVNLFTEVEDTTKRKFTRDLHQWIKDNRANILSAIYTLIKSWWDAGHALGDGINASYPTWAKFCSGVMQFHNLGNPCAQSSLIINDIGGDTETKDICRFNKEIAEWLYDPQNIVSEYVSKHNSFGLMKKDLFSLFEMIFAESDDRPFHKFDLQLPRDRRELGRTINKYIGTYRGGYKLIIAENNEKVERIKYKLVKSGATGATGVILLSPTLLGKNILESSKGVELPLLPQLPHLVPKNDIIQNPTEAQKEAGDVFETQPGVWRKVV